MRLKHLIGGTASAMVLASLACGSAYAQDQSQDEPTVFGELIITAQKREQRLQDVPIVVTVASEQLLEDAGVKDIRDLAVLSPGLTVTATSSEASVTARIRGIGTVGDNPGLESSVGVVIDGVYRPRNGVGFGDLGDVSRIEVLKGPQGTLFGKNTSAGVINVITKEPSFNKGVELEGTAGNFNAYGASANITGPLIEEKLAGSLFVVGRKRDGFIDVVTLGSGAPTKANDQSYWSARGQLLALPNDRFSARIIGDYSDRDESCCAAPHLFLGQAANSRGNVVLQTKPGALDLNADPFDRVAYSNRPFVQKIRDMGLSGELNYDVNDDVKLTSITAIRNWKLENGSDSDYTAADLIWIPGDGSNFTKIDQMSQEFRLAGESGKLNWLIGAFFAAEDIDNQAVLDYGSDFYGYLDQRILFGLPGTLGGRPAGTQHVAGVARIDNHSQEDRTFALFTNNDYAFTDAFTVTAGLRYTSDKKELSSKFKTFSESCQAAEQTALAGIAAVLGGLCVPFMNADFDALGTNVQNLDEDEFSGTLKAAFRFNEQVMAYVSGSRGYKAGGFNLDRESFVCAPNGTPFVGPANYPPQVINGPVIPIVPLPTHSACKVSGGLVVTDRATNSWVADPNTSFRPETVDSYEVGVKTQWFDNSLLLNLTYFDQTFTDFQLNTFAGTQFVVVTLPEVTSKGFDGDVFWNTPVEGLSLQGGATITDTIIGRYTPLDFDNFADFGPVAHMQNRRLGFAPRYTASVAATYETDLSDTLTLRGNIAAKYNSAYNTGSDLNSVKRQEEFTVVNARVGVGTKDDKWRIELWGQNIFDQDYLQVGFNGPFQVTTNAAQYIGQDPGVVNNVTSTYPAFLGAPRTFGITLRSKL